MTLSHTDRGSRNSLRIAALVATHNRPCLLANRSLASIAEQDRQPDCLVIVDDSDAELHQANEKIAAGFAVRDTKTVYLRNAGTAGASGAWNTGLHWLKAEMPDCFVAILDDDDAWDPAYLAVCEREAIERDMDMVAAGLFYRISEEDPGEKLSIAESLKADDFLVGNPNIQGSNLFIRLKMLLDAGRFDELLPSTTDRDLCIRLADLGYVRYGPVHQYLVHHFAEKSRDRLSTPGSDVKLRGLDIFYRKHRCRMNEGQRQEFRKRGSEKFGWTLTGD